jgi:hypothetical protein
LNDLAYPLEFLLSQFPGKIWLTTPEAEADELGMHLQTEFRYPKRSRKLNLITGE